MDESSRCGNGEMKRTGDRGRNDDNIPFRCNRSSSHWKNNKRSRFGLHDTRIIAQKEVTVQNNFCNFCNFLTADQLRSEIRIFRKLFFLSFFLFPPLLRSLKFLSRTTTERISGSRMINGRRPVNKIKQYIVQQIEFVKMRLFVSISFSNSRFETSPCCSCCFRMIVSYNR